MVTKIIYYPESNDGCYKSTRSYYLYKNTANIKSSNIGIGTFYVCEKKM